MRAFIAVLVLIFSLQSWTRADDISDFEIEGMSIGNSLLDYYSKDEIKNAPKYNYKNNKFIGVELSLKNPEEYDVVQIYYKPSEKYIIASVIGGIFFENYNNCKKKKDAIVKVLTETLENFRKLDKGTFKAREDKTGKSTMTSVEFYFKNGEIGITCTNYTSKFKIKNNYADSVRVDISTKEFADWLRYDAY